MRVVTWNVQHGVPDPKGPPALLRAVDPLWALSAEVYALQELDRWRWRTRFRHQAAALARGLGGELVSARAKHWLWASQDNALVVRGELAESDVVRLPGPGEVRVAAVAEVVVRRGRWSVVTTHLSLDPAVAEQQLHTVLQLFGDRPKPWVVLGDLNLLPEQVVPLAAAAGFDVVAGGPTVDARVSPDRRLDHILVKGARVTASGVEKLPLSDHLAAWADLERR